MDQFIKQIPTEKKLNNNSKTLLENETLLLIVDVQKKLINKGQNEP